MTKRAFDVVFSFAGLIILSPVFLITAIIIKADSKGEVLYRQSRVGKNNSDFLLYKFRTMSKGSDTKSLLTIGNNDQRITRAGYYLRKYKLDELPQLINVLKGEMSFVGPRPEVRKYVNLYTKEQMRVLVIKPGITDLASIHYRNENEILKNTADPEKYYTDEIMPHKLKMNIAYINDRSFFKDIKIIFKTFRAIIS
ncbi:MAG: sugar transferase [Ignavibacteria bacterium]